MKTILPNRKGLVLIVTLVLLAAISTMAELFYMEVIKYRKVNRLLEQLFIEEMIAPQIIEKILYLIALYQKENKIIPREGHFSYQAGFHLGKGRVEFYFLPENVLVNLNKATPDEVQRLLEKLGVTPERALKLAQCLADWIDADNEPRPLGAEKNLEEKYFPRNKPLQDFAELLLIKGFDPYLLYGAKLIEQVTLWSSSDKIPAEISEDGIFLRPGKLYRLFISWEKDRRKRRLMVIFRFAFPPQAVYWTFLP